jgi:lactoylglutathione lyase
MRLLAGVAAVISADGVRWILRKVHMTESEFPAPQSGFVVTHFLVVSDQDRSRDFYRTVFGAKVVMERDPVIMNIADSWLILNVGGGPTDDKPTVTLAPPADPDRASAFLKIRVADIGAAYAEWSAKGAEFLTEPKDHGREIRAYIRDPDGHLIEVGQTAARPSRLTKICPGRSRWLQEIRGLRGLIRKEPALITALLFSFVVIKVIWIARGDIPTALGVFDSTGLATVIAGGLLSAFPLISVLALGIATFEIGRSLRAGCAFPRDKFVVVIGSAATVGCFFLTPWPIMLLGAGLGLLIGLLSWAKRSAGKVTLAIQTAFVVLLLSASFVLVLNPLLYAVWLPHEVLTLAKPDGQSEVGYVLSDSNGWVSLLRTGERRIYRFRSEDVKARALCRAGSFSMPLVPPGVNNPSSLWNILLPGVNKNVRSCS